MNLLILLALISHNSADDYCRGEKYINIVQLGCHLSRLKMEDWGGYEVEWALECDPRITTDILVVFSAARPHIGPDGIVNIDMVPSSGGPLYTLANGKKIYARGFNNCDLTDSEELKNGRKKK